jgi:hypothetical protein
MRWIAAVAVDDVREAPPEVPATLEYLMTTIKG